MSETYVHGSSHVTSSNQMDSHVCALQREIRVEGEAAVFGSQSFGPIRKQHHVSFSCGDRQ